jgi:hypothetical protein
MSASKILGMPTHALAMLMFGLAFTGLLGSDALAGKGGVRPQANGPAACAGLPTGTPQYVGCVQQQQQQKGQPQG